MSTAIIKPEWSFITIALMVLGFILFWPLGLAMLAYILWGERYGGTSEKADRWIHKQKGNWKGRGKHSHRSYSRRHAPHSGNVAFDEYREEQLKRLEEERRRLDEEINHFHDHMQNLRMARDRDEFDRFMRNRSDNQSDNQSDDYSGADDEVEYRSERKASKDRKDRKN